MEKTREKWKRVVNIMICSPNDVQFEREMAFKAVHDWNRANLKKDIVLVPIGYEDVAKNFAIKDAQELIEEQIVAQSDMAVVILWSTLGRKDLDGVEYTIGEANHHITARLPLMMFFSRANLSQEADFAAFERVKAFKLHPESKLRDQESGEARACMYAEYRDREAFLEVFRRELDKAVDEFFTPNYYGGQRGGSPAASRPQRKALEEAGLPDLGRCFVLPEGFRPTDAQKNLWRQLVGSICAPKVPPAGPDWVLFGRYPQRHVVIDADAVLLDCVSSDSEGSVFEDRVTGQRYYKPHRVNLAAYASRYCYSDGTRITKLGQPCFQISPIRWQVLRRGSQSSLLLSEQILDWRHFLEPDLIEPQGRMILSTVEGCPSGTRANNWEWSTIRAWLEEVFVPAAFTREEQQLLVSKTVSNGRCTGCIEEQAEAVKLQCGDTTNRAFLLSYADAVDPELGFDPDPMKRDPLRIAQVTDFAIARGVKPSRSIIDKKTLVGWWWLRSPANYKMYFAYIGHRYEGGTVSSKDLASAKEAAQCRVCDVMQDGHVCTRGSIVDGDFIISSEESCDGTANGVRVAIEVRNEALDAARQARS